MDLSFAPELGPTSRAPRGKRSRARTPKVDNRASLTNQPGVSREYEAGSQSRRLHGWRPRSSRPNDLLGSLATLRDRSRQATRNDGYAKGVLDKLVTNIIGTGVTPLPQTADRDLAKRITDAWLEWTDQSDADGLLDFYGQQGQSTRCWLDAGDCFIRRRDRLPSDGLRVPMQVQVLEPELCPHTYNGMAANGNRIRAGIEFDLIGRRVAYYFHPSRPDLDDFDASLLKRVSADAVAPMFDPLRAGQIRGIPVLTPALIRLHELDKFDDATLLKQELQNLFVAFIKRDATNDGSAPVHPLTGQPYQTTATGEPPSLSMEPGIIQELNPGEEMQFSAPPGVQNGYVDFYRQQLRAVCVSSGVPYEILTGDMGSLNDRTARIVLNEFKRRIQMIQHQIIAFQLCRRVWRWFMDAAYFAGSFPIPDDYLLDPRPYLAVKWMPQRWAYVHPVQDVDADKAAIRAGFTSRSDVVSEYGEDAEAIDQQQADDNARADKLGLRYDSDGRQPAAGPKESFTEGGTTTDPTADPNNTDPASPAPAN